ncbi:MAG: DUF374 domain-containing protein [Candidatus Sumerlaeia bacterium]|nr:DUF374 domain-containing protein [Candidatus Sumerlaeia bacterium]
MNKQRWRAAKFWLLERIVLPVAVVPIKLWVRSWPRKHGPPEELRVYGATPNMVIATYHGMLLHLLRFAPLIEDHGRRLVVMTSPSKDGKLLARLLGLLGVDHVEGSSRSRSVAGSIEFVKAVRGGKIGLIAVDGPRGPVAVAKPGIVRLAAQVPGPILLVATTGGPGIRFRSWDRAHLPWPFAGVEMATELFERAEDEPDDAALARMQARLFALSRRIASPVLPPEEPAP